MYCTVNIWTVMYPSLYTHDTPCGTHNIFLAMLPVVRVGILFFVVSIVLTLPGSRTHECFAPWARMSFDFWIAPVRNFASQSPYISRPIVETLCRKSGRACCILAKALTAEFPLIEMTSERRPFCILLSNFMYTPEYAVFRAIFSSAVVCN